MQKKIGFFRIKYSRNIKNLPYLPYAKENTQKLIQEKLIKAINEIENNQTAFYPFSEENTIEENNFKKLSEKFYDNEQNLIHNGG